MTNKTLTFILLSIISTNLCAAESSTSIFTVGYKTWFAKWKAEFGAGGIDQSDQNTVTGPSINIRSGKFFAGANIFDGSFNFDYDQVISGVHSTGNWKFNRKDTEYFVGVDISPYASLVVGQKEITFDLLGTDYSYKAKGAVYGLTGRLTPVNSRQSIIFGSLTMSTLDESTNNLLGDLEGPSVELGYAYVFSDSKISFTTSYKSQRYKVKHGVEDGTDFQFSGVTAGLNYTFN